MQSQITKTVLFGGAAILAYNLLTKGRALGSVNFLPGRIHSFAFDGMTPVLTVGVVAQNTSSQKFVIRSIAGSVYADGYLAGSVSYFQVSEVLPNSQSEIFVQIRFAPLGIVQDIINAFQTNDYQQEVIFKGYANVDNFQVPINNKYKVGL
jgi:hypothetical protein